MPWLEWLFDAFLRPRRKKRCKDMTDNDFRIHQVWGFIRPGGDSEREDEGEILRPLAFREIPRWTDRVFIGTVILKDKGAKLLPGAIIGKLQNGRFSLERIVLLKDGYYSFPVFQGQVSASTRDSFVGRRHDLVDAFPLSCEVWIPFKGDLLRIHDVVEAAGPSSLVDGRSPSRT